MKRAHDLFSRVTDFHALLAATRRAAKGKRLGAPAAAFLLDRETEVLQLQRELLDGSYRPRPYRTFFIRDPKPRVISAAAFRDRVVHHALCAAMEPTLERYASADSYACRPGKGSHAAVQRLQHFTRRHARFCKLDVRHFFETASHEVLRRLLYHLFDDPPLLALTERFLTAGAPGSAEGRGLPIGNLTSQHFANLYLGPLDHFIKAQLRVPAYLRYMDDLVLLGDDRATVRRWQREVEGFVTERLALTLRDEAGRAGPVSAGVPFLGFRVWPGLIRLDHARRRRFCRRVSERCRQWTRGELSDDAFVRSTASLVGWTQLADARALREDLMRRLRAADALPR